jgi:hypothetical protein
MESSRAAKNLMDSNTKQNLLEAVRLKAKDLDLEARS